MLWYIYVSFKTALVFKLGLCVCRWMRFEDKFIGAVEWETERKGRGGREGDVERKEGAIEDRDRDRGV